MTKFRLQKIIASSSFCSRRKAEDFINQKRVSVNGRVASIGESADPSKDLILVDGQRLPVRPLPKVYLINKPVGLISSCLDQNGKRSVLSLLPPPLRRGIYPVGRLDLDSRGALLLTNIGELTLRLSHPRFQHSKKYLVWISGKPSQKVLSRWRNGILLDGKPTVQAQVLNLQFVDNKSLLEVTIREGRNRQIRRVAEQLGHKVLDLQRTEIAGIRLDSLPEGGWRQLNRTEWIGFMKPS